MADRQAQLDTTSSTATQADWSDLVIEAGKGQADFDTEAGSVLSGWYSSRTTDEKATLGSLVGPL